MLAAGFAALFTGAAFLGRATVLADSGISMVWPAAAVSVLWVVARAGGRMIVLDYALMAVITAVVVAVTGGAPWAAVMGGVAAVVQASVCAAILRARCPQVWAGRATVPLTRRELWWFYGAAAFGPLISSPLVELEPLMRGAGWHWDVELLWTARNAGAIVVLVPLGLMIGAWLRKRVEGRSRRAFGAIGWAAHSHPAEWIAVLVLSPVGHVLWFTGMREFALVFPLLTLTCWAGARLPTGLVILHGVLVSFLTIHVTSTGQGPFSGVGDPTVEIAVAQLYATLFCGIGLALALARDERELLTVEVQAARDEAEAQAALFGTIVDTMAEGVRVVDREGRVVVRNPAASRLLLGSRAAAAAEGMGDDLGGLRQLDGTPLAPQDVPYRRALAGQDVADLPLLVRPASGDERIVSFTTARLPENAGGGVVTVLRDVTVERQELHRAAQVQAGLLPTEVPHLPGYELAARFVPAGSVGGDFYDWYGLDHGVVLTLADVMGKGTGAAILAATTRSLLRAHGTTPDVARTLTETEAGMTRDLDNSSAFVTVFRAFLHAPTGHVAYSDAGHGLSAVLPLDAAPRRLQANGLPLGIAPDERTAESDRLDPGDILLVVSDGVLDALGGSLDDLRRAWEVAGRAGSAAEAVAAVVDLALAGEPDDDLTVLALRRDPA